MKLQDFDFRIWDNNLKAYIIKNRTISKYSDSIDREDSLAGFIRRETHYGDLVFDNWSCDCEIELWTGLYDKNGKKIYENDIITLCHFAQKCIGVVRFGRNGFVITSKDENAEQGGELSYFEKHFYDFEVIGNTHENHI